MTGANSWIARFYESEDFPVRTLKIENIQSFVKPKIKDVQVVVPRPFKRRLSQEPTARFHLCRSRSIVLETSKGS